MKTALYRLSLAIVLIAGALSLPSACSSRNETVSCFPNSSINVQINLSLPAYAALQSVGGWMYINEQSDGTRGLILVRTSGGFKCYDRNAPHICPDTNTTLMVASNIKIVCPKDNAEWILLTGQPTAVAQVPPKTYACYLDSATNVLSITN